MLDHYNNPLQSNAPLSYFHFLLRDNNLNNWKQSFLSPDPSEAVAELIHLKSDFEKEERNFLRWEPRVEEYLEYDESFRDVLDQKLRQGKEYAEEYIRNYVYNYSGLERRTFLNRVLNELQLLKRLASKEDIAKYSEIKGTLQGLEKNVRMVYQPDLKSEQRGLISTVNLAFKLAGEADATLQGLADLFESLTADAHYKFLAPNTKWSDFEKVFTGGPVENKLVWQGHKKDLVFFINELERLKKIEKCNKWKTASNCFLFLDEKTKLPVEISNKLRFNRPERNEDLKSGVWKLITSLVKNL
ncbi:hypothetical protein [Adhaeribacter terreus]|uniref:Uncharacterized protein n=1 Tax=Adhaeribacter terreus TaxID=529703 RepID=A0ABW0EAH6_9BACT